MRIAVIGRGKVGSALGEGWTRAGHEVVYGSRTPSRGDEIALADATADADIVVLATPWDAVADVILAAGGLQGNTVIDCTNPLGREDGRLGLLRPDGRSGGETVAALAPDAFVFKTLNQTGAETMSDTSRFDVPPMMFVAGDDVDRKRVVLALVRDLGFEALDAGPLAQAGLLEALAMLWIDQAFLRGQGRDFAFARLRPH